MALSGKSGAKKRRDRGRVAVGGELLGPGRHMLALTMPGRERAASLGVVIGAAPGPRAFVVGGTAARDGVGLAVVRRLHALLDPAALAGSVFMLGLAEPQEEPGGTGDEDSSRARAARWLMTLLPRAAFGVEVRSGPAGRATWPHLRADLRDERLRRLCRCFGAHVVVDAAGGPGSLRRVADAAGVPTLVYEGGEGGRWDDAFVDRALAGVLSLLRARRMLPGEPTRPAWRAVVSQVAPVAAPASGWLAPIAPPGALVAAGELLAAVHDATGATVGEIAAPGRAVLLCAPTAAHVEAGETVALCGRLGPRALARAAAHMAGPPRHRIGWSEWVALPELGIGRLAAKIDTGARTSALHVRSMKSVGERGGKKLLEVRLPTGRRPSSGRGRVARVEVEEYVTVRDSGGHEERRPVIVTTVVLGPVSRRVRVSLTDRGDMLFPMLVGRTALGEEFVVDAAARNLLG